MNLHEKGIWEVVADYLDGKIGLLQATWKLRTDRDGLDELSREYAARHPKDLHREPGECG